MLRTISGLQIEMYKPDILVTMSFDAYGSISDYARGEEISELGRQLMSEALDKYERDNPDFWLLNFSVLPSLFQKWRNSGSRFGYYSYNTYICEDGS